jgi:hypothetical protein
MVGATAQADPMVPLAPPCDQWAFPGDVLIREGGTGWDVAFSSTGQSAGGRATATGPGGTKSGNISGGMTQGGHVTLTVRYDNGQFQQYVGDVGDDAKLHGVTHNNVPNESGIRWSTVFPISCSKAPLELPIPEEVPDPEEKAPPPPPPPEKPFATAPVDTDVYDVKQGTRIGSLRGGQQVELGPEGCGDDQWCNIVWPGRPNGAWTFFGPQ